MRHNFSHCLYSKGWTRNEGENALSRIDHRLWRSCSSLWFSYIYLAWMDAAETEIRHCSYPWGVILLVICSHVSHSLLDTLKSGNQNKDEKRQLQKLRIRNPIERFWCLAFSKTGSMSLGFQIEAVCVAHGFSHCLGQSQCLGLEWWCISLVFGFRHSMIK